MIKISTKGRYGTRVMVELALNYGKGPVLLKDIAKRQDISAGYLDQLVPSLKAAGLITSSRGTQRGYLLTKEPKDITLRDIIEALEGEVNIAECLHQPLLCPRISFCPTRPIWAEISKSLVKTLESFTLDMLVKKCNEKKDNTLMYSI